MPVRAKVDMKAIVKAVTDTTQDVFFIDSKTGDVLKLAKNAPMSELARFKAISDKEPDRFLRIPKSTAQDSYADINTFIATVKDKKLQDRLKVSVTGGGTMRNFLDALQPSPMEYDRWHKYRDARILGRIQDWVKQNGMESR